MFATRIMIEETTFVLLLDLSLQETAASFYLLGRRGESHRPPHS